MLTIIRIIGFIGAFWVLGIVEGDDLLRMQGTVQPAEVFFRNILIGLAMMAPMAAQLLYEVFFEEK